VAWWADPGGRRLPWWHYRHLDLFVHSPNAVTWSVSLPASTTRAVLHSAAALGPVDDPGADGVTFEVSVERPPEPSRVGFRRRMGPRERRWVPFTVDLAGYAGQTITLRFTSAPERTLNADWALYRHPYIDLTLDPARPAVDPPASRDRPVASAADLVLDPADAAAWRATTMRPLSVEPAAPPAWQVEGHPRLDFLKPFRACLADYTHFLVRVGASADIRPRAMRVSYRVEGASPAAGSFAIPLEAAAGLHEYTYDLKLLELDQKARLTGLSLAPVETAPATGERRVEIAEIRLIRDERRDFCRPAGLDVFRQRP
jgi:hypothetical protein